MRIEVETTAPAAQTTALATAGHSTLTVDLPAEHGGAGRGFTGEQLLALSLAASLSNTIPQQGRATRTGLTPVRVRGLADFPDVPHPPAAPADPAAPSTA